MLFKLLKVQGWRILPLQPPEQLGLQACGTVPGTKVIKMGVKNYLNVWGSGFHPKHTFKK